MHVEGKWGVKMRIVTREKAKITKEDFSKLLGVPVKSIELKGSHFKVTVPGKGIQFHDIYLRCADMKGVFGFEENIFDNATAMKKTKDGGYEYFKETEILRKPYNEKVLKAKLKELTK